MPPKRAASSNPAPKPDLVVITGLSGSGKGSVLKALEDLGFYAVDNLPVELIPKFAELTIDNPSIAAAALVVDIREGGGLKSFPKRTTKRSYAASAKPAGRTPWARKNPFSGIFAPSGYNLRPSAPWPT